jgi:hypothetical protein
MTATNTKTTVTEIAPLGGSTLGGYKLGWLAKTTKPLTNDKITVTNASYIDRAFLQIDDTGVAEPNTLSTNAITLTSATEATYVRGLIIYK